MSTPVATVADALISFILSLLHDPAAVEEFNAAPQAAMASNGLEDACAADVQAVKPVIVDHPDVIPKPPGPPNPPEPPDDVIKEITRIINQFTTIDNRTTLVDQSTNQNIWTDGGDVTQIFDQEAIIASGDDAIAAGDDATTIDSDVDVTIGDIAIGNTDVDIDESFNGTGGDGAEAAPVDAEAAALAAAPAAAEVDPADAAAVAGAAVAGAVDLAVDAAQQAAPAVAETEPADVLAADMTTAETTTYDEADAAASAPLEAPIEEVEDE